MDNSIKPFSSGFLASTLCVALAQAQIATTIKGTAPIDLNVRDKSFAAGAVSSREPASQELLPNQPLPVPADGPDNRLYWPLEPGYTWILEDSTTHLPTRVAVYSIPPGFGPSAQYGVSRVYDVHFEKTDPGSYWTVGQPWDLHWFLGYDSQGFLVSTGSWFWDYTTGLQAGSTWNYYSGDSQNPPYLLLMPSPADNQSANYQLSYPQHAGVTYAPLADDASGNDGFSTGMWNVTWSAENISVPAYSGPVITAHYDEGGNQLEDWSFARGLGPVRIISRLQGGNPTRDNGPVEIDLVSYSLNKTGGLPYILTVRDQLAAAANAYGGLPFARWSYFYAQVVLEPPAPSAAQACLDAGEEAQPLDIDTYLFLISKAGKCTAPAQIPAPIASPPVTCGLEVNGSTGPVRFSVGGAMQKYTVNSNTDNLEAYWLDWNGDARMPDLAGTQVSYFSSGAVFTTSDPNGATFVYPPFTDQDATVSSGFTRQIELRDKNGKTVCTTAQVQILLDPAAGPTRQHSP
jgi:hypothetical protein